MKTILTTIVAILYSGMVWGQEDVLPKIGDIVKLKTYTSHSQTQSLKKALSNPNLTKDTVNLEPVYLDPNVKFKIMEVTPTSYKIVAWPPFKPLKNNKKGNSYYYNYKVFEVPKDEFLSKAAIPEDEPDRFSIGILTLPFKFRPQDEKTFEAQFNLSSTLNVRIDKFMGTDFYIQVGAGLGSVELNSNNSLGIGADENINAATLTMFSGLMLQYKKVQAGIYVGVDHINNQNHYQWKNNGNMWFGFGVGYQLFNVGLGQDKKAQNE